MKIFNVPLKFLYLRVYSSISEVKPKDWQEQVFLCWFEAVSSVWL